MRIAIATAVYAPMINGVAVFSHNLARGLAARGHEVLVICPSQTGKEFARREERVLVEYVGSREIKLYPDQVHKAKKVPRGGKQVIAAAEGVAKRFGWEKWLSAWPKKYEHGLKVAVWPFGEVIRTLDEFRPDIVHIQVADLIGMTAERWARKNGVPVVATEHNQAEVLVEPIGVPKAFRRSTEAVLEGYFRRRLNRSDFATMPTAEAVWKLMLGKGASGGSGKVSGKKIKPPIAAVSNGVDLSHFRPGKASAEIYRKYGLAPGMPTVLYVGRVDPEKKVGVVIEAFLKALEEVPEAQLVIVGDGVARKGLEEKFGGGDKRSRVKFLGRVVPPDLYELYRVGDVFATASEIETQGIVLIEAAASGLALIAVNKGAVSEICIDGKDGFLVRPGKVEEMAAAMVKVLSDEKLRKKMSQAAIEEAKKHDFERTLDQFTNIYRRLLS